MNPKAIVQFIADLPFGIQVALFFVGIVLILMALVLFFAWLDPGTSACENYRRVQHILPEPQRVEAADLCLQSMRTR